MENLQKDKEGSKPHVHIFGEEFDSWKFKREDHHREREERHKERCIHCGYHHGCGVILGLMILLTGSVLFLNTMGVVSSDFWRVILPLWPLLLVLLGVRIILGRNIVSRVITIFLAVIIFCFVIFYGLVEIGSPALNYLLPSLHNNININTNY
jgi:hypothetical protein